MRDEPPVAKSLPDQVHNWPPKANHHGFNRSQRRAAGKVAKKQKAHQEKVLAAALNKAAREVKGG